MNRRRGTFTIISVLGLLSGFGAAALLAGCGEDEQTTAMVRVTAPADGSTTRASRVTVRGAVSPADATVQVMGRTAQVANGVYSVTIPLRTGTNDIDVVASGQGLTPGTSTITVIRKSHKRTTSRDDDGTPADNASRDTASCGDGISVGPNTSCAFARNVVDTYRADPQPVIEVYSPVTDRVYTMTCSSGSPHVCTGGNNASVYFP